MQNEANYTMTAFCLDQGIRYSKNPHERTQFLFQADFVLKHQELSENQSEDVLEVLLLNFLEIIYCFTNLCVLLDKWMILA